MYIYIFVYIYIAAPVLLRRLADWLAFEHLVSPAFEHAVLLKAKQRAAHQAPVTAERLEAFASFIVEEYLVCQSARDAGLSVLELQAPEEMRAVLVQKMVLVAFDKKVPDHLLVAQLVSSLVVRDVIAPSHVEAAMELLLKQVGDLLMDMPKVLEYLVALLAHFIQDGLVQLCILDLVSLLSLSPLSRTSRFSLVSRTSSLSLSLLSLSRLSLVSRARAHRYTRFLTRWLQRHVHRVDVPLYLSMWPVDGRVGLTSHVCVPCCYRPSRWLACKRVPRSRARCSRSSRYRWQQQAPKCWCARSSTITLPAVTCTRQWLRLQNSRASGPGKKL